MKENENVNTFEESERPDFNGGFHLRFEKEDGVKYRGNRDQAALEKFIKEKLGVETEGEEEKVT